MLFCRYSYGGSRVQVDADIKVLSEFLSSLQTDTIRGYSPISSLTAMQAPSRTSCASSTSRILASA
jgi:phosphatidylinositol 4-kinase